MVDELDRGQGEVGVGLGWGGLDRLEMVSFLLFLLRFALLLLLSLSPFILLCCSPLLAAFMDSFQGVG